jgi:hypothetical protein
MGYNQRGGNVFKKIKKKAIGSVATPIVKKIASKAKKTIGNVINSKIKNSKVRGLLHNQLDAATPYLTDQVLKSFQGGGRRKKRRRRRKKRQSGGTSVSTRPWTGPFTNPAIYRDIPPFLRQRPF